MRADYPALLAQLPTAAVESIWLGALLSNRFGNDGTAKEAQQLLDALAALRTNTIEVAANASNRIGTSGKSVDATNGLAALRQALEHELKLKIIYRDGTSRITERVVWPVNLEHYGPRGAMLCWCEKRRDFRNFRFDRVQEIFILTEKTSVPRSVLVEFAEIVGEINPDDSF